MTEPSPFLPYATVAQPNPDADHLRILTVLHYVWGRLVMAFSCLFIIHVVMGVMLANGTFPAPPGGQQPPFPPKLGYLIAGAGSCAIVLGWTLGVLTIASGRRLARRRSRVFSMVVAGLNCMSVPFDTTLGVFTFIVLARDSVRRVYELKAERAA